MNNTHFCQFISPSQIYKSAGTWTPTLASNVLSDVRTAADASFTLYIPSLYLATLLPCREQSCQASK